MQVNVHAEPDAQSEGVNANLSWYKDTGGHLQILMHKHIGFKSHNIDWEYIKQVWDRVNRLNVNTHTVHAQAYNQKQIHQVASPLQLQHESTCEAAARLT